MLESIGFVAILSLITFAAVLTWAYLSKKQVEERLNDPDAPKSSLAQDGPGPNPVTEGSAHRDAAERG